MSNIFEKINSNIIKKILTLITFVFVFSTASSQVFNPLSYSYNGTPTHGVKIKTNIPFRNGVGMPTLHFEGYAYGKSRTLDFVINWYPYYDRFYHSHGSSSGGFCPKVKLANEDGKVTIFIDERIFFLRFNIRAFSKGNADHRPDFFEDWVAVDEPISGTDVTVVDFESQFNEKASVDASGTINAANVDLKQTGTAVASYDVVNSNNKVVTRIETTTDKSGQLWLKDAEGNLKTLLVSKNKPSIIMGELTLGELDFNSKGKQLFVKGDTQFDGKVGIGTNTPQNKLSVNGTIWAKEVKVRLTDAADWVFGDTYTLPTLEEVAAFIKINKHLPEIPSAAEFRENDMKVSEMTNKLLQKIEELTLYTIQQEERLKKIEALLNKQSK